MGEFNCKSVGVSPSLPKFKSRGPFLLFYKPSIRYGGVGRNPFLLLVTLSFFQQISFGILATRRIFRLVL